ncbi:MAG: molybdopterin cofactor-binding domain-containing protein [Candidatus Acidiferrales bacterium]
MSSAFQATTFPRRDLLKAGGALIIGFSCAGPFFAQEEDAVGFVAGPDQPDPNRLDTWLAIHADNTATIFIGFVELGQGASTALLQLAAEELDLEMSQVKSVRVETHSAPNQGGTVAGSAIMRGGPRVRAAAAEARLALLTLASKKLNAPVSHLAVSKGVVSVVDNPKQSVTYGELVGGKPLGVPFTGKAPLKPASTYTIVGTRVPRIDVPDKVSGKYVYMQHVRVPGMLHGRIVRPRGQAAYGAGARVVEIDEGSIRNVAGAQVVRKRDFVGVVAPTEWDAVRAAEQLKVTWDTTPSLPGNAGLYEKMRTEKTTDTVMLERGDVASALGRAAHVISQTYRGPYQSHAPFGPNCALADVKADSVLVMCSTQNIYDTRGKVAKVLRMRVDKVGIRYYEGAGTFGHSCYDDAAQAAAILSQAVGKPVRVQFMRWDEHGWDNYGPAHLAEVRAGIDGDGNIVAYEYHGSQHIWMRTETSEQLALGTAASENETAASPGRPRGASQTVMPCNLGGMYDIPNMRLVNHRVPGHGYLKGQSLRSPLDVSFSFASEQAIDGLAHLAEMDPFLFRQRNIKDARWLEVLNGVAKAAGWTPRKAASSLSDAKVVKGRGIALGTHLTSYGAAVAEIEVDKETGRIVAKHMYGALDAGLAVNPGFVENQITGMLVQATSRMLKEEVTFTKTNVTSLDWDSYPILRFEECPEVTAIVVQRLNEKSDAAGEEMLGPAAAAIANAFFDATGERLQEYPLTPNRVLATLGRA